MVLCDAVSIADLVSSIISTLTLSVSPIITMVVFLIVDTVTSVGLLIMEVTTAQVAILYLFS